MGSFLSGNFREHMTTVEDCICLDVVHLVRLGVVQPGVRGQGTLYWPAGETRESPAQVQWALDTTTHTPWMQLSYFALKAGEVAAVETLRYPVRLVQTPQHYGGSQWWFACPLATSETACAKRVRQLYLAPGQRYFGCRHCLRLTYASRQTPGATARREWPAISFTLAERSKRQPKRPEAPQQENGSKAERCA